MSSFLRIAIERRRRRPICAQKVPIDEGFHRAAVTPTPRLCERIYRSQSVDLVGSPVSRGGGAASFCRTYPTGRWPQARTRLVGCGGLWLHRRAADDSCRAGVLSTRRRSRIPWARLVLRDVQSSWASPGAPDARPRARLTCWQNLSGANEGALVFRRRGR